MLTKPDRERGEGDHMWPEFLPGGEAVLFTITPATGGIENAQIAVLDLQTGTSKVLIRGGSHAHYVPTGHLVYGVAWDVARRGIRPRTAGGGRDACAGARGRGDDRTRAPLTSRWPPTARSYTSRASAAVASGPSCRWIARDVPHRCLASRWTRTATSGCRPTARGSHWRPRTDVWIVRFRPRDTEPADDRPGPDRSPLWTPDGQRIIFTSNRAGYPELFSRPADGTGSDERLLARAKDLIDLRATAGRQTADSSCLPRCRRALSARSGRSPSSARPTRSCCMKSEFCNDYAAVSPDGRWMAYDSNVSGRYEIYVERYPELGNRQPISTGGGRLPIWSRDGRELFFSSLDGRQMFARRRCSPGRRSSPGVRRCCSNSQCSAICSGSRPYDIAPDGRFLIIRSGQADAERRPRRSQIVVVQNWFEELKRLVPMN